MGRTETEWLRAAILANGGVCDDLPDNLESTLYKRLIEVCASGGGGGGSGGGVQPDWNQTDETAADFIRNKPFGDVPTVILEEQELVYSADEEACIGQMSNTIMAGDAVSVVFDGENYECEAVEYEAYGRKMVMFGNFGVMGEADTGEPFLCAVMGSFVLVLTDDAANHTVKITANVTQRIPEKYSPVTKLFIREDSDYLYTDPFCTTQANMSDIPNHLDFSVGLATEGIVSYWHQPVRCMSQEYGDVLQGILVSIWDGADIQTYKSAEIT